MSGLLPTGAARGSAPDATRHWVVFALLAATIVVLDQLAKAWVVAGFAPNVPSPVIGDLVRIWFVHNTGALFGLFRDQAILFAALSIGVVAIIVWFHGHAFVAQGWLATLTLGLLLGGAVGNLIDRLRLGYVVDFVDIGIGTLRFYTFNVADSAISVSLVLLILMAVWPRRTVGAAAG